MEKRQLGNSQLMVAPLALGGNVFGWTADEARSFELLDAFTGAGFNLVDTADIYSRWAEGNSGGESETIIGNWMKKRGNRNQVILATKVGSDMGSGKKDLRKSYILSAADNSLRRLQTDHIDLYQTHFDDPEVPVEETLEAYSRLIEQGKVRFIGASNLSPDRLQESLNASKNTGLPRYETFQPHYNLVERKKFEDALEPICLENNLGVISYYSLAGGFLTGKYRNLNDLGKSVRGGGVKKYIDEKGTLILKALDEICEVHRVKPATIALAWLMQRKSVTAPIASATTVSQLAELCRAAEIHLNVSETEMLDRVSGDDKFRMENREWTM